MKNNIMIMNFSGVYEMQGLKTALEKKVDSVVAEAENMAAKPVITQLDFQDIPGTNCYCDSLAEEEIGKRIIPFGPEGLHFLECSTGCSCSRCRMYECRYQCEDCYW